MDLTQLNHSTAIKLAYSSLTYLLKKKEMRIDQAMKLIHAKNVLAQMAPFEELIDDKE